MEMSSKMLEGGNVSSQPTTHHDTHRHNDEQKTISLDNDLTVFIMTGEIPPSQHDIITSLSGKSPGTCDDLHDVLVHLHPYLADDVHGLRCCDPKSNELEYKGVRNDLAKLVHGGKVGRLSLLLAPVVKKVAETDVAGGGGGAAALTTPYLSGDHLTVLPGDLDASRTRDTTQHGWRGMAPLSKAERTRNWFSITKTLPGPVAASRHEDLLISQRDQVMRTGSQGPSTGLYRQFLAESRVGKPLVQAGRFLQASQLGQLEADKAEEENMTKYVVSVVLTTLLPLSGQRIIGR